MNIWGIVLFSLFAALAIAVLVFITYQSIITVKQSRIMKAAPFKETTNKCLAASGALGIALTAMFLFIYMWCKITPTLLEVLATVFGGLGFGFFMGVSLFSFVLHYYGKDINSILDKRLFTFLAVSFPLMVVFMFLLTDGFADYVTYPLVNVIDFSQGFLRPTETTKGLTITFYALCILSGALYVYALCDHKFYKNYGKHGILESTFLVAFPAGILGARLFYVIGQWQSEFAGEPFYKVFAIWEGGLTILGGALTGVVVGVAWFMWRNKKYNIWVAVDIIVPTILIAQAIGRWGNFFNCEVHGIEMSEEYWRWLPKFIFNNAHYGGQGSIVASEGNIFVPLFFIEGLTNFLGFFVLAHLLGNRFRKYTEFGDLAFGYFIWYGLTRAILEPLRYEDYVMTDLWSWFWGLAFIAGGALLIIGNHIVRYFINKRKGTYIVKNNAFNKSLIGLVATAVVAALVIVISIVLMVNSDHKLIIGVSKMNIGVLLAVIGGCILIGTSIPSIHLVEAIKQKKEVVNE